MTFCRPYRSPLLPSGLRLQHRALVEDAKYLKAEAIRGRKENKQKTKQTGRKQSNIRETGVYDPCPTCLHHSLLPLKGIHVSGVCHCASNNPLVSLKINIEESVRGGFLFYRCIYLENDCCL